MVKKGVFFTAAIFFAALLSYGCTQSAGSSAVLKSKLKIKNGVLIGYEVTRPVGVLHIPDGVIEIAENVFDGCTGLSQVNFPSTLKKINQGVFYNCVGLQRIELPENLTELGNNPFLGCASLTSLTVHERNKTFSAQGNVVYTKDKTKLLFAVPAVSSVDFPPQLKTIAKKAFAGCTALRELKFSPSDAKIEEIESGAFAGCARLSRLDFSSCTELTTIGISAFSECHGLSQVKFPSSLKKIDQWAFFDCRNVREFDFTACTQLEKIVADAFADCTATFKVARGGGAVAEKLEKSGVDKNNIQEEQ